MDPCEDLKHKKEPGFRMAMDVRHGGCNINPILPLELGPHTPELVVLVSARAWIQPDRNLPEPQCSMLA